MVGVAQSGLVFCTWAMKNGNGTLYSTTSSPFVINIQPYNRPFRANSTFRAVNPFTFPLRLTHIAFPSGCSSNFSSVFGNAHGQCVGLSTHANVPGHRYLLQVAIPNYQRAYSFTPRSGEEGEG
jgi:hypothetical protein